MFRRKPERLARRAVAMSVVLFAWTCSASTARAQDACYRESVEALVLESEPTPQSHNVWNAALVPALSGPFVVLDGPGEAYVGTTEPGPWTHRPEAAFIGVCAPSAGAVRGTLWWPTDMDGTLGPFRFSIPGERADPAARTDFLRARFQYHDRLARSDVPGRAWFAHRARQSREELEALGGSVPVEGSAAAQDGPPSSDLASTYALISGGRALAENLRLDDQLALDSAEAASVPLADLDPIDLPPHDRAGATRDLEAADPLAGLVPADQHAVFFPDLAACLRVLAEVEESGLPVLQLLEGRAEDERLRARYERQLCLDSALFAQVSEGAGVGQITLTGSDPCLRTGSDVAVLVEALRPELLERFVEGRAKAAAHEAGVERVSGSIGDLAYVGARSADRRVCSYSARIGDVLVVTNSLVQLERIQAVATGAAGALVDTEEYRFFRHRYPRATAGQAAFLVLSDPTIRRWCGPRWRIASSRRLRAAAELARHVAENAEAIVRGTVEAKALGSLSLPGGGPVRVDERGVRSDVHGHLGFMTPIAELSFDEVSPAEQAAYESFRARFEREASGIFDPVGASLSVGDEEVELDLSVFPLMGRSDYNEWLDLVLRGQIAERGSDPHAQTILELVLAIDREGAAFQRLDESARLLPVPGASPLGWVGDELRLYLDAGEEWDAFAGKGLWGYVHEPGPLPLALSIAVRSPLQLAAFLAAARSFLEQVAPGIVQYRTVSYRGKGYVHVRASEGEDLGLWYAALPDELLLSLSEAVVRRAIDRRVDASGDEARQGEAWLGRQVALRVDARGIELLRRLSRGDLVARAEAESWSSLFILNEWLRLFPGEDPVSVHERLFGARPVCPGGEGYAVDAATGLVRSTTYGRPGGRQEAAPLPGPLTRLRAVDAGLSFENDGLRARVRLTREPGRRGDRPRHAPLQPGPDQEK